MMLEQALLVGLLFGSAQGVKIYLSYSDATCVDDSTIQGTATISCDDSTYPGFSYSTAYTGGCLYYIGGYCDADNYNYEDDILDYGTCVTCNGMTGCSSDGTCDNFMTYPGVTQSNAYQMSEHGASSSSNKEQMEAPAYGMALQNIEIATLEAQEKSASAVASKNVGGSSMTGAFIIVGAVGAAAMLTGVAVVVVQFWRRKREAKILSSAILGDDDTPTTRYQFEIPVV